MRIILLINEEDIQQLTSEAINKLNSSAWSEINLDLAKTPPWESIELYRTLMECMSLINKAISLNPRFGEPYGIRAHLHYLEFRFNRINLVNDPFIRKDYSAILKAINDLKMALKLDAKDKSLHSGWQQQIKYFIDMTNNGSRQ